MLRFFYVEDRTLKRHKSIGVFVVYIDTGSSMPNIPSKLRDLADEKNNSFDGMEMIRKNRIAGGCVTSNCMLCETNKSMI
jgi:hypothetical protein